MPGLLARFRRPAAPAAAADTAPIVGFGDLFGVAAALPAPASPSVAATEAADEPAALAAQVQHLRQQGNLEAANAAAEAGLAQYPDAGPLLVEHAFNATEAGQCQIAVARWAAVRARMPMNSIGYAGGFNALNRLGAFEESAALLAAGLALMPQERSLLSSAARQACRRQDWTEAERLWTLLAEMCPDDLGLMLEAARQMMGRRFDRASRRPFILRHLALAQARFPAEPGAFTLQLYILRDAGALADAAAFGAACRARFPQDPGLATLCAEIEAQRGHPSAGLALLDGLAGASAALDAARIRLLCQLGQPEEAEQACAAALGIHPADAAVIEQHVTLATRRGDFAEAAARCAAGRAALPQDAALLAMAQRISLLTQETLVPDATPAGGPAGVFARCESLGGTRFGCEFGMVQRRFGADPIGLLRWANISLEGLVQGLDQHFEGIDNRTETLMETRAAGNGTHEYYLINQRYGYFTHTFIRTSEAPGDRVYKQALRRLRFLATKLLEDVAAAEKTLVLKFPSYSDPNSLWPLVESLRAHGPCTLLCAAQANAANPAGTLEAIKPGVFVGRLYMSTNTAVNTPRGMDTDGWHGLCSAVERKKGSPI